MMNVTSASSAAGYQLYQHHSDDFNNHLMRIERELYSGNEPENQRKVELNSEVFGFINQIEEKLKTEKTLSTLLEKNLQILKIKFGMAAIKSGDTDWESFLLSKEVYDNNELFFRSGLVTLSLDELRTQGITPEDRAFSWNCCQYNFAYNIVYTDMSPPADKMQQDFYTLFEKYQKKGASYNVAVSAANAEKAAMLCANYFSQEEEALDDPLFIVVNKTILFYGRYIGCENPAKNNHLRREGETLSNEMSVFLPQEVKKMVGLDV